MTANPALRVLAAAALTVLAGCTASGPGAAGTGAPASGPVSASGPAASDPVASGPAAASGAAPASSATAPADPILAGRRQVVIAPIPSFESILAVDATGRLTLTDGDSDNGLFVLTPDGTGRHQIKTAKGNPASCMGLKNNGTNPLTVVAADCDPRAKGQLFTIALRQAKGGEGRPTYTIAGDGGVALRSSGEGLIAEEPGAAGPQTVFSFVDNGPATSA